MARRLVTPLVMLLATLLLAACQQQKIATPQINVEDLREKRCLANVIWHESRGESTKGQKAVADVVTNRAAKRGKSICSVVAEPRQFAWFRKDIPLLPLDEERRKLLTNAASESTITTSDHFYSGKKPSWSRKMICRKLERHTFCREK